MPRPKFPAICSPQVWRIIDSDVLKASLSGLRSITISGTTKYVRSVHAAPISAITIWLTSPRMPPRWPAWPDRILRISPTVPAMTAHMKIVMTRYHAPRSPDRMVGSPPTILSWAAYTRAQLKKMMTK